VTPVGTSHPVCAISQLTSVAGRAGRVSQGTNASKTNGMASLRAAIPGGNKVKTMVSTTTFNIGELIMVARTVLELAPP